MVLSRVDEPELNPNSTPSRPFYSCDCSWLRSPINVMKLLLSMPNSLIRLHVRWFPQIVQYFLNLFAASLLLIFINKQVL